MAYCGNCGTKLEGEKFCPNCGTVRHTNTRKPMVKTESQKVVEKSQWMSAAITVSVLVLAVVLILTLGSGSNKVVGQWEARNGYSESANVEFFRDGTFTWSSYGYSMDSFSGKYSVQGNTLNMENPSYGTISLNFKRDGNTLIIESAGGDTLYFHKVQ